MNFKFATPFFVLIVTLLLPVVLLAEPDPVTPADVPGFWIIDYYDNSATHSPLASFQTSPEPLEPIVAGMGYSSLQMTTGAGLTPAGSGCAREGGKAYFGTQQFAGLTLSDIDTLIYSQYLPVQAVGVGAASSIGINIFVDLNADDTWTAAADSILVYEPVYSMAGNPPTEEWFTVDALEGRWWSALRATGPVPSSGGAYTDPFWPDFIDDIGSLEIINPTAGCDDGGESDDEGTGSGFTFVVGQKSGVNWANFVGYLDNVTLETSGTVAMNQTFDLTLPATQLAFVDQPSTTAVNEIIAPPVSVELLDVNGDRVTSLTDDVTVSIGNNPGGGTLSGTVMVAAQFGLATFSDLSIDEGGTGYTLVASSGTLTDGTSDPFDITGDDDDDDDDDDDGGGSSVGSSAGAQPAAPVNPPTTFDCSTIGAETNGAITASGTVGNVSGNGLTGNTFCHVIAVDGTFLQSSAEIGNPDVLSMGVLQAVDVFGLLPGGASVVPFDTPVRLCLRGTGTVLFMSAADFNRTPVGLGGIPANGFTCADVPGAGTVVLAGGSLGSTTTSAPQTSAPVASSGSETALTGCQVTTTYAVRLRAEPSTSSAILTVVPFDLTLQATAKVDGWFRVIFEAGQGWISAQFADPVGNC